LPRTLKRLLITIVVVACSYYAVRFFASMQIAASFSKCIQEVKATPGQKGFKNEVEARAYANSLLECMDKKNGFFAKLFFDKDQEIRDFNYSE
jgi:hypothetical protein